MTLTAKELREALSYDPETGLFTWVKAAGRVPAGSAAGWLHVYGYINIKLKRRTYTAHRLAWLYAHGEWPRQHIDHINGIRNDNRIANLRDVDRGVNLRNPNNRNSSSKTGIRGVYFHKKGGKYRASIRIDGRRRYLGSFALLSEAAAARAVAERESGAFI